MQITFAPQISQRQRACVERAVQALREANLCPSNEVRVFIRYEPEATEARAREEDLSTLVWNEDGEGVLVPPAQDPPSTYSIVLTDDDDLYTALHELCHVVDWSSNWDSANAVVAERRQEILEATHATQRYQSLARLAALSDEELGEHINPQQIADMQQRIHPDLESVQVLRELARVKAADFELFVHVLAQYAAQQSTDPDIQAAFAALTEEQGYAIPMAWWTADFDELRRLIDMRLALAAITEAARPSSAAALSAGPFKLGDD